MYTKLSKVSQGLAGTYCPHISIEQHTTGLCAHFKMGQEKYAVHCIH
jgi:hypothetical protein